MASFPGSEAWESEIFNISDGDGTYYFNAMSSLNMLI